MPETWPKAWALAQVMGLGARPGPARPKFGQIFDQNPGQKDARFSASVARSGVNTQGRRPHGWVGLCPLVPPKPFSTLGASENLVFQQREKKRCSKTRFSEEHRVLERFPWTRGDSPTQP